MALSRVGPGKPDAKPSPASKPKSTGKDYVLDNKGRKITRAEFEKRQEFRKENDLQIKSGESRTAYRKRVEAWKAKNKKKTEAEMKRRSGYRKTTGSAKFGASATNKTRKSGATAAIGSDARKALR